MRLSTNLVQNEHSTVLASIIEQIDSIVLGKSSAVRLTLSCLLAGGHLLIEDLPGMGKTTLARTLGRVFGLEYQRIQFTSDLLPADVIGAAIYDRNSAKFVFHDGPIFAQLVLADEINRATPKTQSALLEAMEEKQITAEGSTRPLPEPFFVVATQNPSEQIGTFPLPESQLDRFLVRIRLGYPDQTAERALLAGDDRRALLNDLKPAVGVEELIALQRQVDTVRTAPQILEYIVQLLNESRQSQSFRNGLSPRAGLGLTRMARAWALINGRDYVIPEDVQRVFPSVAEHRLETFNDDRVVGNNAVQALLDETPVPV